jgi:hypothetical protein
MPHLNPLITSSTEMGHREPMTTIALATVLNRILFWRLMLAIDASNRCLQLMVGIDACSWASNPEAADALCPHHLNIVPFRSVMLCHIMLHASPPPPLPPMMPYGTEGCPGGEDTGHQPLWELMPHHPTPEPLEDGASGYQSPLLCSED